MYALDFEYDGRLLSEYGFIIASLDGSSGIVTVDAGSEITFNTVSLHNGTRHSLTGAQYGECIESTFQICKDPCLFEDLEITDDEFSELARWLNRRHFHKLHIIDDSYTTEPRFYDASFNISKIKSGEILYGIELEMTTNKPFGYGAERTIVNTFTKDNLSFSITDRSDEVGYIYPSLKITCAEVGDLEIYNELTEEITFIGGCLANEVITMDGVTFGVTTSETSHDIHNCFNYSYLKIANKINQRKNVITVNLPCTIEFTYSPIVKNSPI